MTRRLTEAGSALHLTKRTSRPAVVSTSGASGVGIEIKKGKPKPAALLEQLRRYAVSEEIDALVVLTQRSVRLPAAVCGKPLVQITLNQLWGVALP